MKDYKKQWDKNKARLQQRKNKRIIKNFKRTKRIMEDTIRYMIKRCISYRTAVVFDLTEQQADELRDYFREKYKSLDIGISWVYTDYFDRQVAISFHNV